MDPFVLRERFPTKQGSNFSSASLSSSILPGQGVGGDGIGRLAAIGNKIKTLANKRKNNQNSLLAKQNTTKFLLTAQQTVKDIEKQLKWNEETNSWGVILGDDGEELSYYDAVEKSVTNDRESRKIGDSAQDYAYEETSSSFYQQILLKAADRGLKLDADKQKKNYENKILKKR